MTYLLDVNTCLALLIETHFQHARAQSWAKSAWTGGNDLAVCPITELGFLRISTQPAAYNMAMKDAEKLLQSFSRKSVFVPADLTAKELGAATSGAVTDTYLAELAARHSMRLATFDEKIVHAAAELIP